MGFECLDSRLQISGMTTYHLAVTHYQKFVSPQNVVEVLEKKQKSFFMLSKTVSNKIILIQFINFTNHVLNGYKNFKT